MIERPVVLVLGAGASRPYQFPLGRGLYENVAYNVGALQRALVPLEFPLKHLDNFVVALRMSGCTSVDAFLEHRTEFVRVGKAAMAYFLILCEEHQRFFSPGIDGHWYEYLVNMMLSHGFESFGENNLRIITFNYDRSLEYYLFTALKFRFGKSDTDCAEAVGKIPIIHVYGSLGDLPQLTGKGRDYHTHVEARFLTLAADSIRIVGEPITGEDPFQRAHEALKEAEHVIFLGFGYHPENIARLQLNEHRNERTWYYGTAVGMTKSERHERQELFPPARGGSHIRRIELDPEAESPNALAFIRNHLDLFG